MKCPNCGAEVVKFGNGTMRCVRCYHVVAEYSYKRKPTKVTVQGNQDFQPEEIEENGEQLKLFNDADFDVWGQYRPSQEG